MCSASPERTGDWLGTERRSHDRRPTGRRLVEFDPAVAAAVVVSVPISTSYPPRSAGRRASRRCGRGPWWPVKHYARPRRARRLAATVGRPSVCLKAAARVRSSNSCDRPEMKNSTNDDDDQTRA